jgi:hypothetical protein
MLENRSSSRTALCVKPVPGLSLETGGLGGWETGKLGNSKNPDGHYFGQDKQPEAMPKATEGLVYPI